MKPIEKIVAFGLLGVVLLAGCGIISKSKTTGVLLPNFHAVQQACFQLNSLNPEEIDFQNIGQQLATLETNASHGSTSDSLMKVQLQSIVDKMGQINPLILKQEILFIERAQYKQDHHNTATIFQKGEINEKSFDPGGAMKAVNLQTGKVRTILETEHGVIRDPELSYDGTKILFSFRKDKNDDYHIYEINTDGSHLIQLTWQHGVSDIDPIYLPDGDIIFSATREPKFCMCNRHIMANLYRMESDGANIVQMGKSTLFEGHSVMLPDGRVLYDRWEYVDRNFGDAQGLWTMNPDGTNHAIYYGNNLNSPGGVIDARPITGTNKVICVFGSCHDRPWGAITILDRSKGVDSKEAAIQTWPSNAKELIGVGNWDSFKRLPTRYEDPFPLNENYYLASKLVEVGKDKKEKPITKMAIVLLDAFGNETTLYTGENNCFDPMPIVARSKETILPSKRDYSNAAGTFYVQNVYKGTHMNGVEPGSAKYLRIIESPEKRSWTYGSWKGQGQQAPGVNWTSFENKRILGEVPVEEDGSAYFELPSRTYVYFQLLDKDKKMIQSMRSGTMVQPNENGACIGCHEDRLSVPPVQKRMPMALLRKPSQMNGWKGKSQKFSYITEVQPVFNKNCAGCHDFGKKAGEKIVLVSDRNPYFNASYIDLYVKKMVTLVGGGPSGIQQAYSWGSHASKLTQVIETNHYGVNLSIEEKERLYTWMDINGVYYSDYECAYPNNPVGRSPLSYPEMDLMKKYTGINFKKLGGHQRPLGPQISFDRPELSPCLLKLEKTSQNYKDALALIQEGAKRLSEVPRADMPHFIPSKEHQCMMNKYKEQAEFERNRNHAIETGQKVYDSHEYRDTNHCVVIR